MPPESPPPQQVCIIVLREMLIALDLSATVADARPDMQVLWAATDVEVMQNLPKGATIAVAFVDVPQQLFDKSALADRIRADKALLVLLGHDVVGEAVFALRKRIRALPYPFAADDVLGVMSAVP